MLEYSVVSWSALAPSTSTLPSRSSQASWALFSTRSKEREAGISAARFCFAWSMLISEVARRRLTVRSLPASKRR